MYFILIKLKKNWYIYIKFNKNFTKYQIFNKVKLCKTEKKVKLKKEFRTHSCYFDLFYYNNVLGKAHW